MYSSEKIILEALFLNGINQGLKQNIRRFRNTVINFIHFEKLIFRLIQLH